MLFLNSQEMITADDINRINAVFCKATKLGLTNTIPSVEELCENADRKLFKAMMWSHHGLYTLLPPVRYTSGRNMRERGNNIQLPIVKTKFVKNSFIVRCLYNKSTSRCLHYLCMSRRCRTILSSPWIYR